MCEGFGGIATQDSRILFMEPDYDMNCSHSLLLERLGMPDNESPYIRHFVRFQFPDWSAQSFEFDEGDTLPAWANDEVKEKILLLFERISPIHTTLRNEADALVQKYRPLYRNANSPSEQGEIYTQYNNHKTEALLKFKQELSKITGYVPA